MDASFIHRTDALVLCLFLFIAMIIMVPLGRMFGKMWKQEDTEPKGGVSSLLTALFGLSGFILAFTFGMSAARYSNVRDILVEESNDIGTALLRSDLYSDSVRSAFRADFKTYIEARLAYYNSHADTVLFVKAKNNAARAGDALWARATQQSKLPNMLIPSNQMIPALNSMFDIATTVEATLYARVPDPIVYMLFLLALATSFIGGFTSGAIRRKDWIVIVVFALFSSMVTYITLDLGRPMRGIINAKIGEQQIENLLKNL
jgi:hypothetical protein